MFYWLIAFPVGFAYWYGYSRLIPFLILMPKLTCSFNEGDDWVACTEIEACADPHTLYQIDRSAADTIVNFVTELDLVCQSKFGLCVFGSLYFIGYVVGALTFLRLGDIVGRRPVFIVGTTAFCFVSVGIYFATNLYLMYLLTFMMGTFEMVRFSLGYILMMELVQNKDKAKFHAIVAGIETVFGYVIFGCCWSFRSWYLMISITIVISLAQIVFCCLSPESPKFLYSVGRFKDMNKALSFIAAVNGTTYVKDDKVEVAQTDADSGEGHVASFYEALKDRAFRSNLLITAFNWCVCSLSCYMTLYYVGMYPGNLFVNAIILFVGDTISIYITNPFVRAFGFTNGFSVAFTFVFATSVAFEVLNEYPEVTYPCVLAIRIGIILWFSMWYLCQSEYFKPSLSARSFAFCNVLARVLTILSPIIVNTVPHSILIVTVFTLTASALSRLFHIL